MRHPRRFLSFVLALTLAPSNAANAAPPSRTEVEAARAMFAEGLALEGQERWGEALDRFERTATVRTTAQVSFHRGLCLEHLGRLVDALDAFVRVERDALGDAGARHVGSLASAHIAGLRRRIPVLSLHASSDDPITVLLDGHPLLASVLDMALPVDPGAHIVVVDCVGRESVEQRVTVREGERLDVVLRVGSVRPTAPAIASLAVLAKPPSSGMTLPPPADPSSAHERPRTSFVTPIVLGSFAIAAFGTAGVFYGLRASALSDLREGCAGQDVCPDSLRATRDRGRAYTLDGNIALGAGVAGAVAAGLAFIILRPRADRALSVTARGSYLFVEGAL